MTILSGRTKILAVTISVIVLASLAGPAEADDRGALGGMVGGVAGGASKAVGSIMGELGALASNKGEATAIVKNDDVKPLDLGAPGGIEAGLGATAKPDAKVKLKVKVGDTAGSKAKAKVGLSGPAKTKAKVGAKVATKSVGAKVAVPSDGSDGGGYDVGSNDDSIGNELAGLSSYERLRLKRKCVYVLSSPASFNRDAVQVCRVLAQSAGL